MGPGGGGVHRVEAGGSKTSRQGAGLSAPVDKGGLGRGGKKEVDGVNGRQAGVVQTGSAAGGGGGRGSGYSKP
jgi:hypothetical protein